MTGTRALHRAVRALLGLGLLGLGSLCLGCGPGDETAPDMQPVEQTPEAGVMPDARPPDEADAAPDPLDAGDDTTVDSAADARPVEPDMMGGDAEVDAAALDGTLDGTLDAALPDAAPDMAPPEPQVEPDVLAYCDCMFLGCHDLYHQLWGEDEGVARARCFRVGSELPRAADATEGDSLDCRSHWCDEAYDLDDPGLCERAGGLEVCH